MVWFEGLSDRRFSRAGSGASKSISSKSDDAGYVWLLVDIDACEMLFEEAIMDDYLSFAV